MLGYVAIRLAGRNRALLSNQGIPERYVEELREWLASAPEVLSVEHLEAVYLGPGEVMVAADVRLDPDLGSTATAETLTRIRADAEREIPVIARLYLTPVLGGTPANTVQTRPRR
jgi:divalent metal cation (Fe/Co/Zn/Cd) transporter